MRIYSPPIEDQELNPDPAGACATAAGISSGEQEADAAGKILVGILQILNPCY